VVGGQPPFPIATKGLSNTLLVMTTLDTARGATPVELREVPGSAQLQLEVAVETLVGVVVQVVVVIDEPEAATTVFALK